MHARTHTHTHTTMIAAPSVPSSGKYMNMYMYACTRMYMHAHCISHSYLFLHKTRAWTYMYVPVPRHLLICTGCSGNSAVIGLSVTAFFFLLCFVVTLLFLIAFCVCVFRSRRRFIPSDSPNGECLPIIHDIVTSSHE